MSERRTPLERVTGLAGGVAASVRRLQEAREPRVVVYERHGHARVLPPTAAGRDEIVAVAEQLLALADRE